MPTLRNPQVEPIAPTNRTSFSEEINKLLHSPRSAVGTSRPNSESTKTPGGGKQPQPFPKSPSGATTTTTPKPIVTPSSQSPLKMNRQLITMSDD